MRTTYIIAWVFLTCLLLKAAEGATQAFNAYITGLSSASTPLAGTEKLYVLQSGNSRSVAASNFGLLANSGSWTAPQTFQGLRVAIRSSAASTVTASATTDYFLCLDPTGNAITVNLPGSPVTGLTYLVKDCTGQSSTHNITITPNTGNIDGVASLIMNVNFQSVSITYTGAQWSVN